MIILRHRIFLKQVRALSRPMQQLVLARISLLAENEYDPLLNNHGLTGELRSYRSINITGDTRLIYERIDLNTIMLRAVGTHHQLYGS